MTAEVPRAAPPVLRIVRGNPSDADIAALTLVLAATSAGVTGRTPTRERWGRPADLLRVPLHPGPGAWSATLPQR